MKHYFAPVPPVHLESAIATFNRVGRVAFGSNQIELFETLKRASATVWIGASTGYVPTGGVPGINIGKVLYRTRLSGAVMGDNRGRHPEPDLRPATTLTDGAFTFFYELRDLVALVPPIPSANLTRAGGGKIETSPHFLVEIVEPELPNP